MDIKYLFAIITVICISILQMVAFYLGYNGQIFTACIGIITALIGFILKGEIDLKRTNRELDGIYQKLQELFNKIS